MKKNLKNSLMAGAAALAIAGASFGGTMAYYSAISDTVENEISVLAGEQDEQNGVMVVEAAWDALIEADADYAKDMQPGVTKTKDPAIESKVDYSAYVVASVTVPRVLAEVDGAEGNYDLVSYEADTTNWTLIEDATQVVEPTADAAGSSTYYYYLNDALAAGETTEPIFDEFTVTDFSKLDTKCEASIDVYGMAIQTQGYENAEGAATQILTDKGVLTQG